MDDMAEFLFELANTDRLTILSELDTRELKLTQLAKLLDVTVQETSRQLARLSEAKLIEKNSAGSYGLTPFGKLALAMLPSFSFLHEEREYLLSHDISSLPPEFIQRIGELSVHENVDIDSALSYVEEVIKEAEQYIWLMSDQLGARLRHTYDQNHPEKTSFRLILPRNIKPEVLEYSRSDLGAKLEIGLVDDVKVCIAMNEKIAGVFFPDLNGRIDFARGFTGKTSSFHRWCHDLHTFYWDRSRKR